MKLLTPDQARELDRVSMSDMGIPSGKLMGNAGKKVAEEAMEMVPRNSRAKRLEEHYGKTLDIGFRYSF